MPRDRIEGIKRGRMTSEEEAEIERLATTWKAATPGMIARRLNRHPATINWYMIRRGLVARRVRYGLRDGVRADGTSITRYTPEQDARLLELRRQGLTFKRIAAALTAEFGVPRQLHSIQVRCIMLSAYDGGPEE